MGLEMWPKGHALRAGFLAQAMDIGLAPYFVKDQGGLSDGIEVHTAEDDSWVKIMSIQVSGRMEDRKKVRRIGRVANLLRRVGIGGVLHLQGRTVCKKVRRGDSMRHRTDHHLEILYFYLSLSDHFKNKTAIHLPYPAFPVIVVLIYVNMQADD